MWRDVYFIFSSSSLFIQPLPGDIMCAALLILVVFVNIWKPTAVPLKRQFSFIKI